MPLVTLQAVEYGVGGPLLLVAGGSGIVPLMAMLRHREAALANADVRARHCVPARAGIDTAGTQCRAGRIPSGRPA